MAKPTIAVIGGTGAEGSGLAIRWAAAGHRVIIGSRSQEKAETVCQELSELLPEGSLNVTLQSEAPFLIVYGNKKTIVSLLRINATS